MFTPNRARVEDVLNAPSQFRIPVYQRDYKWGKDEALELIEDLKTYQDAAGDNLFLGNLIFEYTKDKKTFVVDGQQRLTTILLLLVACRQRALQLGSTEIATMVLQKINFVDAATGVDKGCRLIASDSVREMFEHITKGSWDGKFPSRLNKKPVKRQANRLKPIYDYFLDELLALDKEQLGNFLRAIYDTFVIRIDIESEVDALSIFERTNARGMELEISDLLKNYLFSEKVEGIEDHWAQIVEDSGGTILRMLKQFYVSKKGYILKPQLYRKLKDYAREIGPQRLTQELVEFSRFFKVARDPSEHNTKAFFEERELSEISAYQDRSQQINAALEALREFGVVQFISPAYAAIESLIRNGGKVKPGAAKTLIRLFEAFEKYHFINNAICDRVGHEVERLYADFCKEFAESKDFVQTTGSLIDALKEKLAKEEEFVANFTDLSYAPDAVSFISYVFDRFNNFGLNPGQWVRIYNPDRKLLRRNQNIEHFLPQKPDAELKVKNETLDALDNVGNLLAISYKTNSRLGNDSPAKKIERLKGELRQEVQNLAYIDEFIARYSVDAPTWDDAKIRKRAKDMALKAYRETWKIK